MPISGRPLVQSRRRDGEKPIRPSSRFSQLLVVPHRESPHSLTLVKLRPRRSTSPPPTRTTTDRGVSQLHEPGGPDASADHSEQTKSREKETLIGAYPVGRAKRASMRCQKYVRKCWGLMVGARCRAISRFGAAKKSVAVRRRHCWRRPNDKVQGRAAAYVAGEA